MHKKRSALVVDDEPLLRVFLVDLLKMRDYEIRTASDGQEAIDLFRKQLCDLILLDVGMPRMGGIEALRHIRALDAHVGIVLMTGYEGDAERLEGEGLGAVLINKPFQLATFEVLLEIIEEDHDRWLSGVATAPRIGSAADHRRHVRVAVDFPATIVSRHDTFDVRKAQIIDISLGGGGMQFVMERPFLRGTEVQLSFASPPVTELLKLAAVVVWASIETGRSGAQFIHLNPEALQALEHIVVEALRANKQR